MRSEKSRPEFARAVAAEFIGTALLVAAVVGSGIMAANLTQDAALALLCNTLATAAMLAVLIAVLAPVSGAHFNPCVTGVFAVLRELPAATAVAYVLAQVAGGIAGVALAHAMFGLPLLAEGATARNGIGKEIAEGVATAGLVFIILGGRSRDVAFIAAAVGLYIASAYWFTSSTSFANPAVTIARALTPTFSGIRPADAPLFVLAEFAGAAVGAIGGTLVFGRLASRVPQPPPSPSRAADIVNPV